MAKQHGFVLMSVLWVALFIGVIFSQIWHQARSLLLHWRYLEQQHEVTLLGHTLLQRIPTPTVVPVTCDGWQQSLQPAQLAALPWQVQSIPEGFPSQWSAATTIICYRHLGQQVWWRKVVRIQLPEWQAVFSQVA